MALSKTQLLWVSEYLHSKRGAGVTKVVSLGYPDLLVNREDMEEIFGREITRDLVVRENSQQIIQRHNQEERMSEVFSCESLFENLACEFDVYDIERHHGLEKIIDLNKVLPEELREEYDMVLDPGTLEHCFNVGTAIINMASMLKLGGCIIHHNPMFYVNHGFYNFSPTFYCDFYDANEFDIIKFPVVDSKIVSSASPSSKNISYGMMNNLIAIRRSVVELVWPSQGQHEQSYYAMHLSKLAADIGEDKSIGLVPASTISKKVLSVANQSQLKMIRLFDKIKSGTLANKEIEFTGTLEHNKPDKMIITSKTFAKEIANELCKQGISRDDILIIDGRHLIALPD